VAIKVRATGGVDENKTVLTDHLGSIVEILDENGNVDISESFAAYGGRRDPADWSGGIGNEADLAELTQRGFTTQTHLDASTLVHLGGRVLDTLTGRFLSPDPQVPHPGDTQSFNRYSYLRNDPLSGVDPSGFFDSRFLEDWTFNIHYSRSHRRNAHSPPPSGCQVTSPQGCYGKSGVRAVIDMIVDKVIGPLPSYGFDDSLVLYFQDPDVERLNRIPDDIRERYFSDLPIDSGASNTAEICAAAQFIA
jgi:RHS repeat-associated protein